MSLAGATPSTARPAKPALHAASISIRYDNETEQLKTFFKEYVNKTAPVIEPLFESTDAASPPAFSGQKYMQQMVSYERMTDFRPCLN